jgi:hypothetical protein
MRQHLSSTSLLCTIMRGPIALFVIVFCPGAILLTMHIIHDGTLNGNGWQTGIHDYGSRVPGSGPALSLRGLRTRANAHAIGSRGHRCSSVHDADGS